MQGAGSVLPIGANASVGPTMATVDLDYEVEVELRMNAKGYAIATVV